MARVRTRQTTGPDDAGQAIAADTHVHLYPGMDIGRALSSGADNLAASARRAKPAVRDLVLFLTETAWDDAFSGLAGGGMRPEEWRVRRVPGDPAALRAGRIADGAELTLIAGRQVQTAEGIEVLALATPDRFEDGRPLADVLSELRTRNIPAVLPWGLGKWFGKRGALVDAQLAQGGSEGLLVGDNAGRPLGWPTPRAFRHAVAQGIPVLPGSDPFPVPGAEEAIGRFGCLLDGALDTAHPAEALRERLFRMRGQPLSLGRRRAWPSVISEQVALRRRQAVPAGQGAAP